MAVEYHEDFSSYRSNDTPGHSVIRKFISKFNENELALDVCLTLIHANNISQMYGKKIKQIPNIREKIRKMDEKQESCKKIELPISGNDVIEYLKIRPGKIIGILLKKIKEAYLENPKITKDDALNIVKKEYQKILI